MAPAERAGAVGRGSEPASIEFAVDVEGIRALTPDYAHLYQVTGNTLPYATQAAYSTKAVVPPSMCGAVPSTRSRATMVAK